MKRLLLIFCIVAVSILSMGVNSRDSAERREYATVDTDPDASGYYTNAVNIQRIQRTRRDVSQVCFSVRGTGSMTVTLQFICSGDASWTDYDTYTAVIRLKIEGAAAGVRWRAGVKDTDYTSGSLTFGFDW